MKTHQAEWQTLCLANPSTLTNTIQYLHHGSLFMAMTANSLLPKADGDKHTSMRWVPKLGGLVGYTLPLHFPVRLALIYESFEMAFLDKQLNVLTSLKLQGQNKHTISRWIKETIIDFGGRTEELRAITHFQLPHHPTDRGAPFQKTSTVELQEAARYRHDAHEILSEVADRFAEVSSVCTWPHHFDTGFLVTVDADKEGKPSKTVGAGYAVPDDKIREPYYYVNHWTAEGGLSYKNLPDLPDGSYWHQKGWKGAVLPASEIVAQREGSAQYEKVWRFLRAGLNETVRLLGHDEMTF